MTWYFNTRMTLVTGNSFKRTHLYGQKQWAVAAALKMGVPVDMVKEGDESEKDPVCFDVME